MFDDNNIDKMMKSILENGQEEVPAHIWEGVSAGLDKVARRKAVVIWWRRAAIGTAAAAVMVFGILFFRSGDRTAQGTGGQTAIIPPDDNIIAVVEKPVSADTADTYEVTPPEKVLIAEAVVPKTPKTEYYRPSSIVQAQEIEISDYTGTTPEEAGHPAEAESTEPAMKKTEDTDTKTADTPTETIPDESYWAEEEPARKQKVSLILSGLTGTNSEQTKGRASIMKRPSLASGPAVTGITETSTNSTYGIPVSAGIGVKIGLSDRWAIGAGVNYSYLSRKFYGTYTVAEDGVEISSTSSDIKNTQHFVGIPINVYCNIIGNRHVNLYAYAGGTVEKCISNRYDVLSTSLVHKEVPKGVQLSANAGIGVEFMLGKHLGLYIDPSLRYYFDNGQPKSIRTTQPLNLGFEMGLRVRL